MRVSLLPRRSRWAPLQLGGTSGVAATIATALFVLTLLAVLGTPFVQFLRRTWDG